MNLKYILPVVCILGFIQNSKAYDHCVPDAEKLKEIMDDRERCLIDDSENTKNFYTVLAEIAACDDYGIESVAVVELYKTRGISLKKEEPCVVKIKNVSSSIGGGDIDLKTADGVKKIRWDANHDITSKNNTVKFWRDMLEPQVIEMVKKSK